MFEARLQELQHELVKGQQRLAALATEQQQLQVVCLHIEGAIAILQELVQQTPISSNGLVTEESKV